MSVTGLASKAHSKFELTDAVLRGDRRSVERAKKHLQVKEQEAWAGYLNVLYTSNVGRSTRPELDVAMHKWSAAQAHVDLVEDVLLDWGPS